MLSVCKKNSVCVIFLDFRPNPNHFHCALCSCLSENHISINHTFENQQLLQEPSWREPSRESPQHSLPVITGEFPASSSTGWNHGKYHSSCRVISVNASPGILVSCFISSEKPVTTSHCWKMPYGRYFYHLCLQILGDVFCALRSGEPWYLFHPWCTFPCIKKKMPL